MKKTGAKAGIGLPYSLRQKKEENKSFRKFENVEDVLDYWSMEF